MLFEGFYVVPSREKKRTRSLRKSYTVEGKKEVFPREN